jgi:hypothetical protein
MIGHFKVLDATGSYGGCFVLDLAEFAKGLFPINSILVIFYFP